jgi:hypothetical protein
LIYDIGLTFTIETQKPLEISSGFLFGLPKLSNPYDNCPLQDAINFGSILSSSSRFTMYDRDDSSYTVWFALRNFGCVSE